MSRPLSSPPPPPEFAHQRVRYCCLRCLFIGVFPLPLSPPLSPSLERSKERRGATAAAATEVGRGGLRSRLSSAHLSERPRLTNSLPSSLPPCLLVAIAKSTSRRLLLVAPVTSVSIFCRSYERRNISILPESVAYGRKGKRTGRVADGLFRFMPRIARSFMTVSYMHAHPSTGLGWWFGSGLG